MMTGETAPGDQVDATPADAPGQVDTNPDGGVPLARAVSVLGISERTARRWIKDGTLSAHKLDTPQGGVWCVHLDREILNVKDLLGKHRDQVDKAPVKAASMTTRQVDQPDGMTTRQHDQVDTAPHAPGNPELIKALEIVDRLQRDNQQLAGQLGFVQAKLQEAEKTIALLMAPKDEPEQAPLVDTKEPRPRRWWQRLFR